MASFKNGRAKWESSPCSLSQRSPPFSQKGQCPKARTGRSRKCHPYGGPRVRILSPPAESPSLFRIRFRKSRTPAFRAEGAARCSKPPKPISRSKPAFVHVKGAPGIPGNLVAELVDANKRRFWLRDGDVGPVARRQTHRAPPKPRDQTPFGHAHDAAGCI
jgi:hypothetical protein